MAELTAKAIEILEQRGQEASLIDDGPKGRRSGARL